MAWEQRRRGAKSGYFYRSVRIGTKVKKIYLGRSGLAFETAENLRKTRENRKTVKQIEDTLRNPSEESEMLAKTLQEWSRLILDISLILDGQIKKRGCWTRQKAN